MIDPQTILTFSINFPDYCKNLAKFLVSFQILNISLFRHEVPVSSEEIKIISKNDDLVVVNKPPSIPVHPCGRYRHNTVVFILAKEYGLKNLRTIHR